MDFCKLARFGRPNLGVLMSIDRATPNPIFLISFHFPLFSMLFLTHSQCLPVLPLVFFRLHLFSSLFQTQTPPHLPQIFKSSIRPYPDFRSAPQQYPPPLHPSFTPKFVPHLLNPSLSPSSTPPIPNSLSG